MSEVVLLSLVFVLSPGFVIVLVACFYYRIYNQKGDAVGKDPKTAWRALRGTFTALLEILAVISIGAMVFILAWQKIMSAELAAAFYSGLIGYFVGSARARTPKSEE